MRIDVSVRWWRRVGPGDVAGRVVAVIDVLRASTTIAVALANGARAVIPLESSEERDAALEVVRAKRRTARGRAKHAPDPGVRSRKLAARVHREAVEGKTVLLATTNGTPRITNTAGARDVVVASYVNFSAVVDLLRAALRGGADMTLVCAGRDRQFSLEDAGMRGTVRRSRGRNASTASSSTTRPRPAALIDRNYGDDVRELLRRRPSTAGR